MKDQYYARIDRVIADDWVVITEASSAIAEAHGLPHKFIYAWAERIRAKDKAIADLIRDGWFVAGEHEVQVCGAAGVPVRDPFAETKTGSTDHPYVPAFAHILYGMMTRGRIGRHRFHVACKRALEDDGFRKKVEAVARLGGDPALLMKGWKQWR